MQNFSLDVERLRVELKDIKDDAVELQKIIDRWVVNISSKIKCVEQRFRVEWQDVDCSLERSLSLYIITSLCLKKT